MKSFCKILIIFICLIIGTVSIILGVYYGIKNREKYYLHLGQIGRGFHYPPDNIELKDDYDKYSGHRYKERRRYNFKRYYTP